MDSCLNSCSRLQRFLRFSFYQFSLLNIVQLTYQQSEKLVFRKYMLLAQQENLFLLKASTANTNSIILCDDGLIQTILYVIICVIVYNAAHFIIPYRCVAYMQTKRRQRIVKTECYFFT